MQMKMTTVLFWMILLPGRSFLQLNVSKTNDVITDLRCEPPAPQITTIMGQAVEVEENYKHLSCVIDNTEMLCKKGRQRLFCLRKMVKFSVDRTVMCMFYKSHIILTFSMICRFGQNCTLQNCDSQWL